MQRRGGGVAEDITALDLANEEKQKYSLITLGALIFIYLIYLIFFSKRKKETFVQIIIHMFTF